MLKLLLICCLKQEHINVKDTICCKDINDYIAHIYHKAAIGDQNFTLLLQIITQQSPLFQIMQILAE